MAEALLRQLGGFRFEITSTCFEPGQVKPLMVEAVAVIGSS